jgi:hypothetical protein
MFELTNHEWGILRSQIATSKRGGARYQPFVFTELGVSMLSSVLSTETAIAINIHIMRAFVAVRNLVLHSPANEVKELQNEVRELKQYMNDVFSDYNDINEDTRIQLELINETLAELQVKNRELNQRRRIIGFGDDVRSENNTPL